MFCAQCGSEVSDNAQFCKECGTPIASNESPTTVSTVPTEKIEADYKLSCLFGVVATAKSILLFGGITLSLAGLVMLVAVYIVWSLLAMLPVKFFLKKFRPVSSNLTPDKQKRAKNAGITVGIVSDLILNAFMFNLVFPEIIGLVLGCIVAYMTADKLSKEG